MLRRMIRRGFERKVDENGDKTYEYVLSNEDVLEICKTENVLEFIRKQQENYLGHIARHNNTSMVKRLLFNNNKNFKRGRPAKTLEDYVLNGRSADQFYKEALKKRRKDMVGHGSNRSKQASAGKS